MEIPKLVNLCSRAWSLTALALIANKYPARISTLAATAGCSWASMHASVDHLQQLDLLERNPGHGHPLRPEFRLTDVGKAVASWAGQLNRMLPDPRDGELLRTKWSLPIIKCIQPDTRYSAIKRQLAPVTDRALSQSLTRLKDHNWIKRSVDADASPPLVGYACGKTGLLVHKHLENLPGF